MRILTYVVAISWAAALFPAIAQADEPPDGAYKPHGNRPVVHTVVESRPVGVYVQISVRGSVAGSRQGTIPIAPTNPTNEPTSQGTSTTSSSVDHGRFWTDADGIHHESASGQRTDLNHLPNVKAGIADGMTGQIAQRPGEFPYLLMVDGQFQGGVWIPTNANVQFGPPPANPAPVMVPLSGNGSSTDPYEVALDILEHLPMPPIEIRMNPGLGLVAMPGWYWVEVRVRPTSYKWSFGDGHTLVSQSLGKRYPAESDIQHAYEYSSLQFPSRFPVRLTIGFAAEFRVDGGPAQPLPSIERIFETGYHVQEVQPVLTHRSGPQAHYVN